MCVTEVIKLISVRLHNIYIATGMTNVDDDSVSSVSSRDKFIIAMKTKIS